MKPGDEAFIRLHRGYEIPITKVLGRKLSQQYVGPFKITDRIGRLAYRLDIPSHWRVHDVFSVAQLEPAPSQKDSYDRPRPDQPDAVYTEGDTATKQSFELERLLDRRSRLLRGKQVVEYLVRWKGWGPEYDKWL